MRIDRLKASLGLMVVAGGCLATPAQAAIHSLRLETADHHSIATTHYFAGRSKVLILAHGFFNNKDTYLFKTMAQELFKSYDVIAFDFRGHGKSNGLFSWTTYEVQDLEAVLDYAKAQKYQKIGVLGFSLGAAVTLIEASHNRNIVSVIAVSAPCDFDRIDYHFWEPAMLKDLELNFGYKGQGKSVRPGNPFMAKVRPIDIVAKISPTPVLFIHGSKDWLIKPYHSETLYAKALEPKQLVIVAGAGHAEKIYDDFPDKFMRLCQQWFHQTMK